MEKNILLPLDMNNTTFNQPLPARLASNMSSGYVYSNNAYTAEPFEYVQIWPASSMISTSEDMAKFMIAHLQKRKIWRQPYTSGGDNATNAYLSLYKRPQG